MPCFPWQGIIPVQVFCRSKHGFHYLHWKPFPNHLTIDRKVHIWSLHVHFCGPTVLVGGWECGRSLIFALKRPEFQSQLWHLPETIILYVQKACGRIGANCKCCHWIMEYEFWKPWIYNANLSLRKVLPILHSHHSCSEIHWMLSLKYSYPACRKVVLLLFNVCVSLMTCEVKHIFSYAYWFFILPLLNYLLLCIATSLVHCLPQYNKII